MTKHLKITQIYLDDDSDYNFKAERHTIPHMDVMTYFFFHLSQILR